jgi:NAD(P)-dependent dehydrogenase (short-subunit alcohol dehydrogenase family)
VDASSKLLTEYKYSELAEIFPQGKLDEFDQQLDLRKTNTWITEADGVDLNELVEVYIINSIAPYVLATSFKPLLEKKSILKSNPSFDPGNSTPSLDSTFSKSTPRGQTPGMTPILTPGMTPIQTPGMTPIQTPGMTPIQTPGMTPIQTPAPSPRSLFSDNTSKFETDTYSWIINVTSMEGVFNWKHKSSKHPHTNMAKAALNMFTRTCGQYYIKSNIVMVCVDTGWNNSQSPLSYDTHTPVDCVDGAARILDPIYRELKQPGILYKDFENHVW